MNQDLYQQHILEHAKHPKNKAQMEDPDVTQVAKNVSCGDSYIAYLRIEDDIIIDATFSGVGCAISTAAASLVTEHIRGKTLPNAERMNEQDVYSLLGVPISTGREKCALLLYRALQGALRNY